MSEFTFDFPPTSPTLPDEAPVAPTAVDHVEVAISRLVEQFRKPKIIELVRYLCTPMAALEQATVDMLLRTVDNATGDQLLIYGKMVGQPPVDVSDTVYKSLIRARILANKSSGTGNQVLKILRLILAEYAALPDVVAAGTMKLTMLNLGPAAYVVRADNIDLPWELANLIALSFLEEISGDGIRGQLEFTVASDGIFDDHDHSFTLADDATPGTSDTDGFADYPDPGDGSGLRSVIE